MTDDPSSESSLRGGEGADAGLPSQPMMTTTTESVTTSEPGSRNKEEIGALAAETLHLQHEMWRAEEGEEDTRSQRARAASRTRMHLLETEITDYKRKLTKLQEGQQRQLSLIQTLQTQANQYKRKSKDLEIENEELKLDLQTKNNKLQAKAIEADSRLDVRENMAKIREEGLISELENLSVALEQERAKSSELSRINEQLQDQIDEAASANQGLGREVAQLTQAWRTATQHLERRETEWQTEEIAFNEYFASEHNRLLALWREVVALRRQFTELRHQTARDFSQMNTEIMRFSQSLQAACTSLASNLKNAELSSADALAKTRRQLMHDEEEAKARVQSLAESLTRSQSKLIETEGRLMELTQKNQALVGEIADRDRVLSTLRRLRSSLPPHDTEMVLDTKDSPMEDPVAATRRMIEQVYAMHQALSQIAQTIISDTINADADEAQEPLIARFQQKFHTGEWFDDPTAGETADSVVGTPRPRSTSPPSLGVRDGTSMMANLRPTRSRSPVSLFVRETRSNQPRLAESTVLGVQTALNRRAMQVQALRLKLSSLRGRISGLAKRLDEADTEKKGMADQSISLRANLETVRTEADGLRLEKDKAKNALSLVMEEKHILERARTTGNEQIASLQTELETLRQMLHDAANERDSVTEQRDVKQLQYESESRETSRLQRLLDIAEVRTVQIRDELNELRELQRQTQMEKDVLVHEKMDLTERAERVERKIIDLEVKIASMRKDEEELHDAIVRLETISEARECERQEIAHQLHLVQNNENRLGEERNAARTECAQLRTQLSRTEMEAKTASGEIERLKESLTRSELGRKQAEGDATTLRRERMELSESYQMANRQINNLTDEIELLRKEAVQHMETISRNTGEKEEFQRERMDLIGRAGLIEREKRQLSDLVSKLRTDKDVMENDAFVVQRQTTELNNKVEKLETEVANLTLRRNTLQAEVHRIRTDFEVELGKIQRQRDRLGTKYSKEVDELRMALQGAERQLADAEEAAVQAVLRADRAATEAANATLREADRHGLTELECQRWAEEQERLNHDLMIAQRERDEALLKAEQERQHVLKIAADDHATVRERIMLLQETVLDLEKTLERTKRDASARSEKDEATLKMTTEDLRKCRELYEDTCSNHEREVLKMRAQIKTLENNFEKTVHDFNEVQLQLRLNEESRTSNRSEMSETAKLLRETEESRNNLRRECLDLRKQIAELEANRSNLESSNTELRRQLRDIEIERVEQGCNIADLQSRLESCEQERWTNEKLLVDLRANAKWSGKTDVGIRREVSDLRQQLKEADAVNGQMKQTIVELRTTLSEELCNMEDLKKECEILRERILDGDGIRQNIQNELNVAQRHCGEIEERLHARERTMSKSLDDAIRDYRRLEENNKRLQSRLDSSEQMITKLQSELSILESKLQTSETELQWTSLTRKDAETRLSAIHSILRRLLGFRQSLKSTGWVNTTHSLETLLSGKLLHSRKRSHGRTKREEDEEEQILDDVDRDSLDRPLSASMRFRRARSTSPDKKYNDIESRSLSDERLLNRLQPTAWSEILEADGCQLESQGAPEGGSACSPQSPETSMTHIRTRMIGGAATSYYPRYSIVAGSDLDPEAVSSALRELLRHLLRLERDYDDASMALRVGEEQTMDIRQQIGQRDDIIEKLQNSLGKVENENKDMMQRIANLQDNLAAQESLVGKTNKEKETLQTTLAEIQRRLDQTDAERRQLQERLTAVRKQEAKVMEDFRQIRRSLEEAESKVSAGDVTRRSLEGDIQRQRGLISDKTTEIQVLKSRLEMSFKDMSQLETTVDDLNSTVIRLTQTCERMTASEVEYREQIDRLSSRINHLQEQNAELQDRATSLGRQMTVMDHDHRILQERFDGSQNNLYECKDQIKSMHERIQTLQNDLADADIRKSELETQNRQLHHQNNEQSLKQKDFMQQIASLQHTKENIMEKLNGLTKSNADYEKKKTDLEVEVKTLKNEGMQLRRALERMAKERAREKEVNSRLLIGQDDVKKNLRQLEEDNLDLRRHIQRLQAQLTLQEETHTSQLEEAGKQKTVQIEAELEKKCSALQHSEKVLQAKEKSHRQRIRGLEEQIKTLSDQLTQEIGRRYLFMSTGKLPTTASAVSPPGSIGVPFAASTSSSSSYRYRFPSGSHLPYTMTQSRETLMHPENSNLGRTRDSDPAIGRVHLPPSGVATSQGTQSIKISGRIIPTDRASSISITQTKTTDTLNPQEGSIYQSGSISLDRIDD